MRLTIPRSPAWCPHGEGGDMFVTEERMMNADVVRFGAKLRAGTALTALAIAGLAASPAFAEDRGVQPMAMPPAQAPAAAPAPGKGAKASRTTTSEKGEQAIVITGTVSRQTQTASPVTVVSASNLQDRGITTVSDAVQQLA